MAFNSFQFLLFFPVVMIVYYLVGGGKIRGNVWLLLASYYFYMSMKPIYGLLLLGATTITYFCALYISKNKGNEHKQKVSIAVTLICVFGLLFIFKYFNFVSDSICNLLSILGLQWHVSYLNILLPVGISFYIFQVAGYIIDVYRGKIEAERNFMVYALFASFFPVILAGPIQRSYNLIPQLKEKHKVLYENVICGLKMMLWGYFMKLCVADRLGTYVDSIFNNLPQHNGTSILVASLFYTIQIYGDFAGYSLVALGCARTMGFKLPDNFRRPYFSLSFKEFWKRWHIGLSSWFGDYLYIPLGGNRVKYWRYLLNLMIVFLVSGLWHGAAWTFVLWGALHGLLLVLEAISRKHFGQAQYLQWWKKGLKILFVFIMVNIAWVFFRAGTIGDAFYALQKMISVPTMPYMSPMAMLFGIVSLTILFVKDFADEYYPQICMLSSIHKSVSILTAALLAIYVMLFGVMDSSQFIYFQF